jgi:c-di-GMP-binding flagellar brake protein YcgR
MGVTNPFPEPESPALDPFTVFSAVEIAALLERMKAADTPITVYFDHSNAFSLTSLLAVQAPRTLIFDTVRDERRLSAAEALTFVGFIESIKVQFTTGKAESLTFDNGPAFRVTMPERLLRLQRRDAFRVRTLAGKPAQCLVPYGPDGSQYEKLQLLDISVGGAAVLTQPQRFQLQPGKRIPDCYLDLPGIGSIGVTLQVRHFEPGADRKGGGTAGCEFVDVSSQARNQIQRYVNLLDMERRKVAESV